MKKVFIFNYRQQRSEFSLIHIKSAWRIFFTSVSLFWLPLKPQITGCFRNVTNWYRKVCLLRIKRLVWDLLSRLSTSILNVRTSFLTLCAGHQVSGEKLRRKSKRPMKNKKITHKRSRLIFNTFFLASL